MAPKTNKSLYLVSLGCPKNRVDSELILGKAERHGFEIVASPEQATHIVVNTCGFIMDAKKESIDTILQMASFKATGKCQKLTVTGCLSQRYPQDLAKGFPEVDLFLGSGDLDRLDEALDNHLPRESVGSRPGYLVHATDDRTLSTASSSAYVKIAEGCDRTCAFCVIPQIRGHHRSRPIDDVVREVEQLASQGVLEINLISQDTNSYGRDQTRGRPLLAELVERIAEVPGLQWVRLLYLYPEKLDDRLIELLGQHPRVLPYVDMPMQHASDSVLKRMRRGHNLAGIQRIIERLRRDVPDLTLRSSFIVGFPGETDKDFSQLLSFIEWAQFDRLGVFRYSDEDSTRAFDLHPKVAKSTSYNRARKLASTQRKIARELNRKLRGQRVQVLVERMDGDYDMVMEGRYAGQAPDIDGKVFFTDSDVRPGQLWEATVVKSMDYDLVVRVEGDRPIAEARTTPVRLPII